MMRFDGLYGKLVKDWGLEEWTKFYVEHYAPAELASNRRRLDRERQSGLDKHDCWQGMVERASKNNDHVKRLFCGPHFTDDELAKYVHADLSELIDTFDAPLSLLCEGNRVDWELSEDEQEAKHKAYCENYPSPPVAEHVFKRLNELGEEAIEKTFAEPIRAEVEGMDAKEAKGRIGGNFWCQRKGYSGTVERAINAREYAYLVARYPDLRSANADEFWADKEGYTRFYQQYVDYFANLIEADLVRLDKCKRKLGMTNLECHNRFDDLRIPKNINYCDTADGCWVENLYGKNEALFIHHVGDYLVGKYGHSTLDLLRKIWTYVEPLMEKVIDYNGELTAKFFWDGYVAPESYLPYVYSSYEPNGTAYRLMQDDFSYFLLDQFGSLDAIKQHLEAA